MLKQTCQKSPLKQTVVAHSIYFHELKFSIKSVFGYNFRQNLAFQEFLNSNFRSVFAFHDFIEFPYSNFRQNLAFHAIFRLSIADNYNFSVQKIVIKLLKSENCLWRFQNKNRKQISLVGQQFSVTIFSKNLAEW